MWRTMYQRFGILCGVLFFIQSIQTLKGEEYTPKEKEAIKQFRQAVSDVIGDDEFKNSDEYIIRFVRDSDLNVRKANAKFRQYLEYRKERKLDEVLNEDMSDMRKWCDFRVQGTDNESRPLLIWPFGNCDLRRIVLAGKQDRLKRYLEYLVESVGSAVRKSKTESGKQVAQAVGIMDLNGFSLRRQACLACLPFYTNLIKALDANYPQGLKSFNIINTPKVFNNVLERVITVAAPQTKSVIKVYGYDKAEWLQQLLKTIRSDQLPFLLGGTRSTS